MNLPRALLASIAGFCLALAPACSTDSSQQPEAAQPSGPVTQLSFDSPEDAVKALTNAAATGDREYSRQIFGPEAAKFSSGDPERDARERARFVQAILKRHDLRDNGDGS